MGAGSKYVVREMKENKKLLIALYCIATKVGERKRWDRGDSYDPLNISIYKLSPVIDLSQ